MQPVFSVYPASPQDTIWKRNVRNPLSVTREIYPGGGDAREVGYELSRASVIAHQLATRLLTDHKQFLSVLAGYGIPKRHFDWAGAQREFRKAIELSPNDATAHQFFASYFIAMGQFGEARIELQRAQELDPLSVFHTTVRCLDYFLMREDDRAIKECGKALELDPDFARAHGNLALIYERKASYDRSFGELETALTLEGESPKVIAALRKAYQTSGMKDLWKKQIELGLENAKRGYVDPLGEPFGMVYAYANLGENDQALAWLQSAYEQRSPGVTLLKVDPGLDPLRSDPRFQAILQRIGLVQ